MKQTTNKNLLYSIGNSTYYLIITYNGKEYKKCIYIFIYIYMNHFAEHLNLTQHCKSTILQHKNSASKSPLPPNKSFPLVQDFFLLQLQDDSFLNMEQRQSVVCSLTFCTIFPLSPLNFLVPARLMQESGIREAITKVFPLQLPVKCPLP